MFDSLEKIKTEFIAIFEGEAGLDICISIQRAREASRSFIKQSIPRIRPPNRRKLRWFPPPQDGSVSNLVRYAINYLKYIATEGYNVPVVKLLLT
ncbi:Exocyst complex component EXO70I [Linum perenne]